MRRAVGASGVKPNTGLRVAISLLSSQGLRVADDGERVQQEQGLVEHRASVGIDRAAEAPIALSVQADE